MRRYNEMDYATAVARVRAISNKSLDKAAIEKMIAAKTVEDAMRVLTDLGWPIEADYEAMLQAEMARTIDLLASIGGEQVLKLARVKYDFHNLKVLIKSELLGISPDDMLVRHGNYDVEVLKKALLDRKYNQISAEMAEAIVAVFDHYARMKDPQMIDILLDGAMFKMLLAYAKEQPDQMVQDLIKTQIDLYNIKAFVRIRQINKSNAYIELSIAEGGFVSKNIYLSNAGIAIDKVDAIFAFTPYSEVFKQSDNLELSLEKYFTEKCSAIKMKAFGLAPLFDFLMKKETEINSARMIFTCKHNGISAERIHARL